MAQAAGHLTVQSVPSGCLLALHSLPPRSLLNSHAKFDTIDSTRRALIRRVPRASVKPAPGALPCTCQSVTAQRKLSSTHADHLCLRKWHQRKIAPPNCCSFCLALRQGSTCAHHMEGMDEHGVLQSLSSAILARPSPACRLRRIYFNGGSHRSTAKPQSSGAARHSNHIVVWDQSKYLGKNETTISAWAAVSTHSVNIRLTAPDACQCVSVHQHVCSDFHRDASSCTWLHLLSRPSTCLPAVCRAREEIGSGLPPAAVLTCLNKDKRTTRQDGRIPG